MNTPNEIIRKAKETVNGTRDALWDADNSCVVLAIFIQNEEILKLLKEKM